MAGLDPKDIWGELLVLCMYNPRKRLMVFMLIAQTLLVTIRPSHQVLVLIG